MAKDSINNGREIGPGLRALGDPREAGLLSEKEIYRISKGILSLQKVLLEINNSHPKKETTAYDEK